MQIQSVERAYVLRGRLVCLRSLAPLINAAPIEWADLAYEGEWHGHVSGPFEFSREKFQQAIANFERQRNPLKLDFDHETDLLPAGSSVPARGFIHKLEIRDDVMGRAHLWALTEFGPEAVEKNRAGGYRFSSGVFDFDHIDRVTGEKSGLALLRVALTDDPFVDGQAPILLSRSQGVPMSAVNKAELAKYLRRLESEDVAPDQVHKLASALALLNEAMGGKPSDKPEGEEDPAAEAEATPAAPDKEKPKEMGAPAALSATPPAAPVTAPVSPDAAALAAPPAEAPADPAKAEAQGLVEQLMQGLGVDLAALLEMLKGMGGQQPAAPAPLSAKASEHQIAILSKRATEAETELARYRETEANREVETLVLSGRLLDSGKDFARKLFLSSRKDFDAFAASLPAAVPVGEHATKLTPPTQETPSIDESNPRVRELRRQLANVPMLSAAEKDAHIRRVLSQANGTRV